MIILNKSEGFLLMEFHFSPVTKITFFLLLLNAYSITVIGNIVIIFIISTNKQLHKPMYFFLINLSCLDLLVTGAITPKFLSLLVSGSRIISYVGCMIQCYIFFFLGSTQILILTVMSFDRYMAICHPLHYTAVLRPTLCLFLALGAWACAFLDTIAPTILVVHLAFCGLKIDHFFCDVEQLVEMACTDTKHLRVLNFMVSAVIVFGSLILIFASYINIIIAVLKIPSSGGRWKTFATCSSHLLIVFMHYIGTVFMSLRSIKNSSIDFDKLAIILHSVLTPLFNPFIYTLRNQEVKHAMKSFFKCGDKYIVNRPGK